MSLWASAKQPEQKVAAGDVLSSTRCSGEAPRTLVYDTEAAALAVGPHVPGHLAGLTVAVEDGHTVYALTTLGEDMPLSLEALSWAPCTRDAEEPGLPTHEWSWKSVAAPPPPFGKAAAIVAYAVHPDGRTVFVSTRDAGGGGGEGTYSFDGKRGEWRWHGAWVLPFRGQGYFDVDLDAWVGLHEEPGYVCCCQVASRGGTSAAPPDSDKVAEKLFCKGGEGAHLGATLTYVGDSRFCLVESVVRGDAESACDGCLVRVTMFGLKFNRMGKLRTTSHRTTNSYAVPKYGTTFSPILAFCMYYLHSKI
ncbi:hypothetical protein ACP70R_026264 [Stipagrostis hirtigluma subsp. patula]